MSTSSLTDKEIIEKHGGAAKLAKKLGYSVQRVYNWECRGIPPKEKIHNPRLLLNPKFEDQATT